jgi:Rps23 Pro-64 3,4-dihydroxylase Tpa1-like proline 4-hydroxylase
METARVHESNHERAHIAPFREVRPYQPKGMKLRLKTMIDLNRITASQLESEPYRWAAVGRLFAPQDAAALAATFPEDRFKRLATYDGQKEFEYEVRCLIRMGEKAISSETRLSDAWRALAGDLLSPGYRAAMSSLTGFDLGDAPLEVNVFHYPPGGSHGAHPDHRDKIVSHVLYFNDSWNDEDGGCLTILRSSDPRDVARTVSPLVGNSAVLVRSDDSWHAVSRVAEHCRLSRRSLTATFYRPGCVSTVWPSWHHRLLRHYPRRAWARVKGSLRA